MNEPLKGDEYGNVRVLFQKDALQAFVDLLNQTDIRVGTKRLRFNLDEYVRGSAIIEVTEEEAE